MIHGYVKLVSKTLNQDFIHCFMFDLFSDVC